MYRWVASRTLSLVYWRARWHLTPEDMVRFHDDSPNNAGIAQLVEYFLAKEDVEGSNPFARSKFLVSKWMSSNGRTALPQGIFVCTTLSTFS